MFLTSLDFSKVLESMCVCYHPPFLVFIVDNCCIFYSQYMLRQGKSAVQALHEVEVLTTDYVGEETLQMDTDSGHQSTVNSMTVHTVVRGRLHVRTGNIGRFQSPIIYPMPLATADMNNILSCGKISAIHGPQAQGMRV